MKVTAIIPDNLIKELKSRSKSKTLTDCMVHAISEWVSISKLKELNGNVSKSPLVFNKKYSAYKIRTLNRS